jgi:hypothetical protein
MGFASVTFIKKKLVIFKVVGSIGAIVGMLFLVFLSFALFGSRGKV